MIAHNFIILYCAILWKMAAIEVRHRPTFHVELLLGLRGLSRIKTPSSAVVFSPNRLEPSLLVAAGLAGNSSKFFEVDCGRLQLQHDGTDPTRRL